MLCFAMGSYGAETEESGRKDTSMNSYRITRVEGAFDWEKIPVLTLDHILWLPDQGVEACGQFCYDEDSLYVHLQAVESDIRAENTEPLSPVCQDSCLEFFFRPEGEERYFNFEINPNGCLYIGFGHDRSDSTALWREDMKELFFEKDGLFPSPAEISLSCSCPDYAIMCKHVAAVLYGVGARFDEDPMLFFELRGVEVSRFIDVSLKDHVDALLEHADNHTDRMMDDSKIDQVFGTI